MACGKTTAYGQNVGWLYDVWLCERLVEAFQAQLLPRADVANARAPYQVA